MTLFENPIQIANQVRDLNQAVARWQQRLRQGDIDESGPFIGKPELTERDAFREIAERPEPEPVKRAWARWAFRLTEARVDARLLANAAHAYRVELHVLDQPERLEITLAELWNRTLTRPLERRLWLDFLNANGTRLSRLSLEVPSRYDEIARRAGFADAAFLLAPASNMAEWAERLLVATDDIYRELVPSDAASWFDAALALTADQGWPAQCSPRSVQHLLGRREWFDGLELPRRTLPSAIAGSSFARALYQLGTALQHAALPRQAPFVVAGDPYGLYRHTVGWLCAQLTTSARWQMDVLGLARTRALAQARAMGVSHLIASRSAALGVLLWDGARGGSAAATRDFEALSHRALGHALPIGLAGFVPRLRADAGQRLIGQWLAAHWARELIAQFDEDWYRNPSGIEAVRDRLSRILPTSVEKDEVANSLATFAAELHNQL